MEEYQQKFIPIVLAVVAVVAFVSVVATTGPYLVRALIEHVRENWPRRRRQDPEPEMDVDEFIDYISERQGEPARHTEQDNERAFKTVCTTKNVPDKLTPDTGISPDWDVIFKKS